MEPHTSPCPKCGARERRPVGANQFECVECGLGSTTITLTLGSSDTPSAPDPETRRRLDDHRSRARAVLDDPPFPLLGLDDRWMGQRSLGGHGGSGVTKNVTLAHGDGMAPTGPLITVETDQDQRFPNELIRAFAATSLVSELAVKTGRLRDDVRAAAYPGDDIRGDPTAPWHEVPLPVDDVATSFRVLAEADHWVALGAHGDRVISIVARSWPLDLTGLVTITNLDAYRAGTEEQFRRFG